MDQELQQQQLEADAKIAQLEVEYAEACAADNFFETASGKISIKIANLEIERCLKLIASDAFVKDHTGYVNCLADLHAMQKWSKRLQLVGSPTIKNKLATKLKEAKDGYQ